MHDSERNAVLEEARSWRGTAYHHMGQVKGAGVDCLTLLACVFANAGMIPRQQIAYYPKEWHLFRSEELYLGGLERFCTEVAGPPLPADIALFKFGRCFSHGAIVVKWPAILHAYIGQPVEIERLDENPHLTQLGGGARPIKFFRLKRWC